MLTRLGLDQESIHSPIEALGRGVQQKVSVARALLSRPRLLLLDEPARGLDVESRERISELVREQRDEHGITVLVASGELQELSGLCERIVRLKDGKIHMPLLPGPESLAGEESPHGEESLAILSEEWLAPYQPVGEERTL